LEAFSRALVFLPIAETTNWNGGADETRTRDLLRDGQATSFFQLHCLHTIPLIISNLGSLLSLT